MHQRTLPAGDGRDWHCVEHTRADGETEIVGRCDSTTVWWACAPGTIWHVTAAELAARPVGAGVP